MVTIFFLGDYVLLQTVVILEVLDVFILVFGQPLLLLRRTSIFVRRRIAKTWDFWRKNAMVFLGKTVV